MSTDTVSTEFCLRLAQAWATLSRRLDNALGSHHGIGFADYLLLLALQRAPGGRLGRSELARQLGLGVADVTRALLPLEKIGLVARQSDPQDARAALAWLTAAGSELVTNAGVVVDNVSRNALGGAGRDQLEAASALLAKLAEASR